VRPATRWLPAAFVGAMALAMLVHGSIEQPAGYNDFADVRSWLGIARAADVLSNAPFAIMAAWGLWKLRAPPHGLPAPALAAYRIFFVSLALTAFGSACYHLDPDNDRLLWDRLPIALGSASLIAAVHAQTHAHSSRALLVWLSVAAMASVIWWWVGDRRGAGDLRPYLGFQVATLVLVPLWQWQARRNRRERIAFALAIALYVLAKVAEVADREIYAALSIVSGHTIKHLLAAAAAVAITFAIRR
jgi:hypothetical protein